MNPAKLMLYPSAFGLKPSPFIPFLFTTEECLDASLHVLVMRTFPVNPFAAGTPEKILLLVEGVIRDPSPCLLVADALQKIVTQEASRQKSVLIKGQKALVDQLAKLLSGNILYDPNDLILGPSRSKSGVACQDRPILFSSD